MARFGCDTPPAEDKIPVEEALETLETTNGIYLVLELSYPILIYYENLSDDKSEYVEAQIDDVFYMLYIKFS